MALTTSALLRMLPPTIRETLPRMPSSPQALIHARKRQLNGDAHVVPDAGGRGAGAAAEAVDGNDIRTAAGNAAGDGRHIVHRGNLDDHRLAIAAWPP